ncbi:hypothetical protein [Streptomyces sp. NPDC047042]|uniref:hypothetical protein n=1 Tax=Streptomyces sp. NPDC047042 TaxID=3154807 RepID=UPI003403AEE7
MYDALARWARRHALPAPVCDFTGRIRHTLALLTEPPVLPSEGGPQRLADDPGASVEDSAGLARLRGLLEEWLYTNPQVVGVADREIAA